jgi:hypothetical protein
MPNKVFRPGKTKRDHKSGAHKRCIDNKLARDDWSRDPRRTNDKNSFPYHTCNGKRNKQT